MTNSTRLRGCPFCGGAAAIERAGSARQSNIVACTDCGCRVESGDIFDPGRSWNARVPARMSQRFRAAEQVKPPYDCETCRDDPMVCASIPGLRHCEKAMRYHEQEGRD
jgi:hypothetical protein